MISRTVIFNYCYGIDSYVESVQNFV